jgi:HEAT repeat protein
MDRLIGSERMNQEMICMNHSNQEGNRPVSKSHRYLVILAFTIMAIALPLQGQGPTPLITHSADHWIAVLQSPTAGHKDKVDACRQLAVIGTAEALPALVPLLADEQLSHMARYAMETMPDPAVDAALREALGTVRGRLLVGVIASVGVRGDTQAVGPLTRLLSHPEPEVAQAAARALGSIGNPAAAKALREALSDAPLANRLAFHEGMFRAAESLSAAGQRRQAVALYDDLRGMQDAAHQVRAGATRGAILARGRQGVPILREGLSSADYVVFAAAVRAAQEMPGAAVTRALAAALSQLPEDNQIVVIQALGLRGDTAALPELFKVARSGSKPVRMAAVRTLPELEHRSTVPVLVELMRDSDSELAQAAQESLAAIPGPAADKAVMAMMDSEVISERLAAMDLVTRRRMMSSLPKLLTAAGDPNANVRAAALRRVGELGGANEVPALIQLLMQATEAQDRNAAEQALAAVSGRAESPTEYVDKLIAPLAQADPEQRSALLRLLTVVGGPIALEAVRGAVQHPNPEVRATAIRSLSAWNTADAAPELIAWAKTTTNPTERTLSVRGYLGFAAQAELPADQRLAMCREAAGIVQQDDEKRLLLAALGRIQSLDSLAMIVPHLDDPATREEASAATVAVAEGLLKGPDAAKVAPRLIEPLEKAAAATANADLAKRARAQLEQARNRAG